MPAVWSTRCAIDTLALLLTKIDDGLTALSVTQQGDRTVD